MAREVLGGGLPASAWTIVGLGLYWAWTFSFNQESASTVPLFVLHTTSMAGASAILALVALRWRRLAPLYRKGILLACCGAVASLASFLYLLPGVPDAAAVAGACVSGCAAAPLVCALGERFCRIPVEQAVGGAVLFLLLAYVVTLVLGLMAGQGAPRALTGALTGLLPAVAAATLLAPCAPPGPRGTERDGRCAAFSAASEASDAAGNPLGRLPWRAFLAVACVYFAVGGIRAYTEHVAGGLAMDPGLLAAGIAVLALMLVAVYSLRQGTPASLAPVYKAAMPLVIVGYVMLVSVGPQIPQALSSIAHLTCLLCAGLCWLLSVESVWSRGVPPLLMMAVSRLLVNVGMMAGELACMACFDAIVPFAVATVLVLAVSSAFVFTDREASVRSCDSAHADGDAASGSLWGPAAGGEAGEDAALPSEGTPAEGAPSTGAPSAGGVSPDMPAGIEAWGLTGRERDVLGLWATSHGARAIGEELGLSESTVKTHIRHIYEKSGVRNRAELVDLIDAMRGRGR